MQQEYPKPLSEEELHLAIQECNKLLTPRDKDGHIVPVTFMDSDPEELCYPCFTPDEQGCFSPIIDLREILEGKIPQGLTYVPGIQEKPLDTSDPNYLSSIRYSDPVYHLPPRDQHLLRQAKRRNAMAVQIMRNGQVQNAVQELEKKQESPGGVTDLVQVGTTAKWEVFPDTSGRLICRSGEKEYLLTNFSVRAVEHRVLLRSGNNEQTEHRYIIEVSAKGNNATISLAVKDIDNILAVIQRKLTMCYLSPEVMKGQALLSNYVREQLFSLPERLHICTSGFLRVNGRWVFAHDGANIPGSNVVFETGRTIVRDDRISPQAAFRNAAEFLTVSDKSTLIVPLWLVAHLSPLFNLFSEAGHIPRFVTFVSGRTGSMKTSVALSLFRLFQEQSASPEASFKDTLTALELKLGEGNGKVILVDDYRPPVTSQEGKENLTKLESVVRAAGDRIGKSRSNSELGKAKEFLPTSCVVITGEDLGGSQSSQLRMLILPIMKGDIKGPVLKRFQDDPLLLSSHMYNFLCWAGERGDEIIRFIKDSFQLKRDSLLGVLKEARLVDTAAILMITAGIVHQYGKEIHAFAPGTDVNILYQWEQAILQAAIESERISRVQNPVAMYLRALFDMMAQKEICIAEDIGSYQAGVHSGYRKDGELWLWTSMIYSRVTKYWVKLGVAFPLSCEKTNEHLFSAGLIKGSREKRSDGREKLLYGCKSAISGRPRLLVLREELARSYLENEAIQ